MYFSFKIKLLLVIFYALGETFSYAPGMKHSLEKFFKPQEIIEFFIITIFFPVRLIIKTQTIRFFPLFFIDMLIRFLLLSFPEADTPKQIEH